MEQVKNSEVEKEALRLSYSFEGNVDFKNRVIRITEEIDFGTFAFIDAAISELESINGKLITIRINCPGGSAYDALAIVGRIKSSKCKITTEGYGHVMSAATLILAAGTKRRLSKYATFMWHQSSYGVEAKHKDVKILVEQQEREEKLWAKWIAELSRYEESYWYAKAAEKDFYLNAQECLEHGVVDELF
jgi:ATP-dependent Clp protease protease subunit